MLTENILYGASQQQDYHPHADPVHAMTHSICTMDAEGMVSHFQRLGRTLLAPDVEPRTRLVQLLEHESVEFDMEYGFLTHIDVAEDTERIEVVHGPEGMLQTGFTMPLSKTYCRKTIEDPEGTLAISDALAEGWEDDPAYETLRLRSYLGTTVTVGDELYGTLCFADHDARDDPLVDNEKALLEVYGQWAGYVLTGWGEPSLRTARVDTVEDRAVSPDAIDSMMEALTSRTRRVVLRALLGADTETSIDTLVPRLSNDGDWMRLYHVHLPKLAHAGYVEWDTDAETVSRGPKFAEVEPLVQLLDEYETALPE